MYFSSTLTVLLPEEVVTVLSDPKRSLKEGPTSFDPSTE